LEADTSTKGIALSAGEWSYAVGATVSAAHL
jgi:hypothetical protein